jgi:undecaprenyl-diphosphatase
MGLSDAGEVDFCRRERGLSALAWLEALILGLIQGLTEFLPVSSDGHLALGQALFDHLRSSRRSGSDKLLLDIILHLGTLVAVLIYYRNWFLPIFKRNQDGLSATEEMAADLVPQSRPELLRVTLLAIVATLPTGVVGLVLKKAFEQAHDSLYAAAIGFWVTAAVLWLCQKLPGGGKGMKETTFFDAFLIGLAQSLAPLPGVSRSGMTIAAALGRGLSPAWAAVFSLWISLPAIGGALVMELKDLIETPDIDKSLLKMGLVGAVVSGIVGYFAILWLVRVVRARRLEIFSIYLVLLGVAVLGWAFYRN